MPWMRFNKDFDWWVKPSVCLAYKAGSVVNVPTPCAEAAKVAGAATQTVNPKSKRGEDGRS